MRRIDISHLNRENQRIFAERERHIIEAFKRPEILWPWYQPCKIRVLVITDGNLDFSSANFGLSTFVTVLLDSGGRAKFEVSLGHLGSKSTVQMMGGETRIAKRTTNFKFDDPADFAPNEYDVVFLFGIGVSFSRPGNASNGQPYPSGRLADPELQALAEFQNSGGGLFATGDHGALGRFMGQALPRARHMRIWNSTSLNDDLDEVSMGGQRRNDTNRLGDPGSQFDDQSDDIPQSIQPRMYSRSNGLFEFSFPHPLLCGPDGPIRVMPDHPHEGECIEASDTGQQLNFMAPAGAEFPPATDGGARPLPQLISTNSVLAGTTSGSKDPTVAHNFGGICAYDGHRASIGRVVTDATWHHFVNVNLVGDLGVPSGVKSMGFFASPSGQGHFEQIKTYYRNLATWLARPENIRCMNSRFLIKLVRADRVLEAVLTTGDVRLEQLHTRTIFLIGKHARDVLGQFAGRCQTQRLIIDLIWPEIDKSFIPEIDPWFELAKDNNEPSEFERALGQSLPWTNLGASLDVALGAALIAINREVLKDEEKEVDDATVRKAATSGARQGFELAIESLKSSCEFVGRLTDR